MTDVGFYSYSALNTSYSALIHTYTVYAAVASLHNTSPAGIQIITQIQPSLPENVIKFSSQL